MTRSVLVRGRWSGFAGDGATGLWGKLDATNVANDFHANSGDSACNVE